MLKSSLPPALLHHADIWSHVLADAALCFSEDKTQTNTTHAQSTHTNKEEGQKGASHNQGFFDTFASFPQLNTS